MTAVLNLYAGIGGNRHLWPSANITAIESDPRIAAEYSRRFPQDEVIVADAHEYLREHHSRFSLIWSSPPCPTHSRMYGQNRTQDYPDLRLYEEILFLSRWHAGTWIVENVKPWYKPLLEPSGGCGRHIFWSNLNLLFLPEPPPTPPGFMHEVTAAALADFLGIEAVSLTCNGNHEPKQAMRNCVHPKTGLALWKKFVEQTAANPHPTESQIDFLTPDKNL